MTSKYLYSYSLCYNVVVMNSGTLMMLIIFGVTFALLVIVLLIAGFTSKDKKVNGALKFFGVFLAIATVTCSILTALVNYDYIPINLRFGDYSSVENSNKVRISRDSIELHENGASEASKRGTYTLKDNKLIITYTGGSQDAFYVKDMGTKLCDVATGKVLYKYISEGGLF